MASASVSPRSLFLVSTSSNRNFTPPSRPARSTELWAWPDGRTNNITQYNIRRVYLLIFIIHLSAASTDSYFSAISNARINGSRLGLSLFHPPLGHEQKHETKALFQVSISTRQTRRTIRDFITLSIEVNRRCRKRKRKRNKKEKKNDSLVGYFSFLTISPESLVS